MHNVVEFVKQNHTVKNDNLMDNFYSTFYFVGYEML